MALSRFPILLCPSGNRDSEAFSVAELYPTHSHSTSMGSFQSSQHPNACILRALSAVLNSLVPSSLFSLAPAYRHALTQLHLNKETHTHDTATVELLCFCRAILLELRYIRLSVMPFSVELSR